MTESESAIRTHKGNGVVKILFLIYLLFLIWAILWKLGVPYIGDGVLRSINLIPFNDHSFPEMRFNVLVFLPLGFYLSALAPRIMVVRNLLILVTASALLELAQYVLAIGYSDITDLMLNTLGGAIGIVLFSIFSRLFGKNMNRAVMAFGIVITLTVITTAGFFLLFGRIRIH
ncbi:MAG: VanZ family protein [Christensenella sp.]|nr:VanZ family protein [Christensenella sp.]